MHFFSQGITPVRPAHFCSADQCTLRPVQPAFNNHQPTVPDSYSSLYDNNHQELTANRPSDIGLISEHKQYLSSILPPDYLQAMMKAAKKGFLYSFISTTPANLLEDYFKQRHFTEDQIFYANLCVKTLAALSLAVYLGIHDPVALGKIISLPAATALMKYFGATNKEAQYSPLALLFSLQLVSDLSNSPKTLVTSAAAAVMGFVGEQAANLTTSLVKDGFFSIKNISNDMQNNTREALRNVRVSVQA